MENVKLRAEHIAKSFGEGSSATKVISDISMDIAEKEMVCILGPSGCGKSTFMKILGGILPASSGRIVLDGTDYGVQLPREILRRFGFVFQGDNLLQWRTAEGNLRFNLETMHLKGPQWNRRVDEMLEIVGLSQYRRIYPHELSGGMKQRVGIARAYANSPNIMLLDEPFGQLDAQTRMFMQKETARIWEQEKRTVIFVTNNIDEALFLGDRIILMEGKLPGSIKTEYMIDLPRPREHTSMELLKLRSIITDNTALVL